MREYLSPSDHSRIGDSIHEKVISYRIREDQSKAQLNQTSYIIERYIMRLKDELSFFKEHNISYYIQYDFFPMNQKHAQEFFLKKFDQNGYTFRNSLFNSLESEFLDSFNQFLATHYFPVKNPHYSIEDLNELNKAASKYIPEYNDQLSKNFKIEPIQKFFLKTSYVNKPSTFSNSLCVEGTPIQLNNIVRVECINVGQGNFSVGYDESDAACAVFDIGVRRTSRKFATHTLMQLKDKGIVVISHYDADHISGYQFLNTATPNITGRTWILPEPRINPTAMERNLLALLKRSPNNHCLFLQNRDYTQKPFDALQDMATIANLHIYQGNCQKIDTNQSTEENARSLICLIKDKYSILLPGDSLYNDFPTNYAVDYLVIPHHCCEYDSNIINLDIKQLKKVIICAGPNKKHHHPNKTHTDKLCISNVVSLTRDLHCNDASCFDGKTKISAKSDISRSESEIVNLR